MSFTDAYDGGRLLTRVEGRRVLTPLALSGIASVCRCPYEPPTFQARYGASYGADCRGVPAVVPRRRRIAGQNVPKFS